MTADRPSICLCMIVKDEVDVLERCFESCHALIDRWVICDTGSTDGTQDLLRRMLADIPGELHEHDWVNFGHNRSELMRIAYGKADYLLLLDADMTVAQYEPLPVLTAGSYMLRQGDELHEYRNKRLVRGDLHWRYVGSTHEYIDCTDVEERVEQLDAIVVDHHADGRSWTHKFERDLALLSEDLSRDPNNSRALFYLAQTYRDIGNEHNDRGKLELALEHYQRRAEIDDWAEETYFAQYQVGVLSARLGDWPGAVDAFLRAWERRPARLEAVHALAVGLRERGLYRAAHRFTRLAASLRPLPVPDDILFVAPWIYKWGMLFEYSITAYWCGEPDASILACKRLLAIESLPESHRLQTRINLQHAFRARVRQALAQPPPPPRRLPPAGTPTRGRSLGR
jgi:tetratricopeptide (TPR) repeat protein